MSASRLDPLSVTRGQGPVPGVVVLAVEGDLVLTSRDVLRAAVESEVEAGAGRVILDLSGATHIDMPGFALLVRLQERCREGEAELIVAGLPTSFLEVFESLRLTTCLPLTEDVETAIELPE